MSFKLNNKFRKKTLAMQLFWVSLFKMNLNYLNFKLSETWSEILQMLVFRLVCLMDRNLIGLF